MSILRRPTVLVVEDDPDQLIIRCMLLTHHGFETRRAGDSETAIRLASEEQPEIAVIDLRLPTEEMGLSLIRELRALLPGMQHHRADRRRSRAAEGTGLRWRRWMTSIQKGSSSKALVECLSRLKVSARD